MGYSSFGFGPCLAEGVLCFELCEQRLTPPMSNSLFCLAGIKRCIFSVFLLGFRTFYPLHVLEPHKIIPLETTQRFLLLQRVLVLRRQYRMVTRRKMLADSSESTPCPEAKSKSSAPTHELPMMGMMGLGDEPLWFKSH